MKVLSDSATPAEVASAALRGIDTDRQSFRMDSWMSSPVGTLLPETNPASCGTTLCAAGWVAHVSGWTVMRGGQCHRRRPDGSVQTAFIGRVARDALGLPEKQTFWYVPDEAAYNILQDIAAGRPFDLPSGE
jgi:hypothetical protein